MVCICVTMTTTSSETNVKKQLFIKGHMMSTHLHMSQYFNIATVIASNPFVYFCSKSSFPCTQKLPFNIQYIYHKGYLQSCQLD